MWFCCVEPIAGRASVTDGDTVVIHGTRIRLFGIDAPESAQVCEDATGKDYRCGQVAALALSDRIGAAPIACEPRDTDRYGRTVAVCRKGAEDLNAWMVAQGHAVAFRRYSADYVGQEAQARSAKRGICGGHVRRSVRVAPNSERRFCGKGRRRAHASRIERLNDVHHRGQHLGEGR